MRLLPVPRLSELARTTCARGADSGLALPSYRLVIGEAAFPRPRRRLLLASRRLLHIVEGALPQGRQGQPASHEQGDDVEATEEEHGACPRRVLHRQPAEDHHREVAELRGESHAGDHLSAPSGGEVLGREGLQKVQAARPGGELKAQQRPAKQHQAPLRGVHGQRGEEGGRGQRALDKVLAADRHREVGAQDDAQELDNVGLSQHQRQRVPAIVRRMRAVALSDRRQGAQQAQRGGSAACVRRPGHLSRHGEKARAGGAVGAQTGGRRMEDRRHPDPQGLVRRANEEHGRREPDGDAGARGMHATLGRQGARRTAE
mmetsp:Transcript_76322/g.220533  ORF Transcript_76322/g.220533 Transcript_76322/m.220533 type:complete len:317 (+) Transcript_76322:85-1035(+)